MLITGYAPVIASSFVCLLVLHSIFTNHRKRWVNYRDRELSTHSLSETYLVYAYCFLFQTEQAKKVIRNYNKMAAVLLEYELTYHRAWLQAVQVAKSGLNASILVRHPETKKLYVNFDPDVLQLIQEAKYMSKFQLHVPEAATQLCKSEAVLKHNYVRSINIQAATHST